MRFLLAFFVVIAVFVVGFYAQYASIAMYTGTLPCADCAGIKTTLTLSGNHTYTLQSLYIDRGTPFTEKGVWEQMQKNNMPIIQLKSGQLTSYYQIVNGATLKMLDIHAMPIHAPFDLELQREK